MNTLTKVALATTLTAVAITGAALPAIAESAPTAASSGDRLEGMVELSRISTSTVYGFLPAPSASDAQLRLVDWKTAGTWTTPGPGDTGEIRSEGLCLTASPLTQTAAVTAATCTGSLEQQWTISPDGHLSQAAWGGSTFSSSLGRTYLRPATTPAMKLELGLLSPATTP